MSNPTRLQGRVTGFQDSGQLVIASDASLIQAKRSIRGPKNTGGMGWVASDGRWGMSRWNSSPAVPYGLGDPSGPSKVIVLELRAVRFALAAFEDDVRARLLVDSENAVRFLRKWQEGSEEMPPGYSLRERTSGDPPGLLQLAWRMPRLTGLTVEKVEAHVGHPLNEAADSLAKIAVRHEPDRQQRAEGLVRAFVSLWHEQGVQGGWRRG